MKTIIKHFTISELEDDQMNIGTICNVENNIVGIEMFKERLKQAIYSHFDCKSFDNFELPDIFDGMHEYDLIIRDLDLNGLGEQIKIKIAQTWLY